MKLSVSALSHVYARGAERRVAVRVDALQVSSGGRLCLVGRSGSGKTTLLNALAGVLVPTRGRVEVGGTSLFELGEAARDAFRARHIGCVFQSLELLQGLSVLENLTLAQRFAGIDTASARRRALELIERVGLAGRQDARPRELSIGEQQRLAVARAVSKRPGLLLADEPTASLDDDNASQVVDLLLESGSPTTVVIATHDPRVMQRFEDVMPLGDLASSERSSVV